MKEILKLVEEQKQVGSLGITDGEFRRWLVAYRLFRKFIRD